MTWKSKAHILTKDFLLKHYVELGKSSPEIASEFPVSATLVKKYLIRHNIPRRPCTDKAHEKMRELGKQGIHPFQIYQRSGGKNAMENPESRQKVSESKRGKKNPMYGQRGKLCPRYIHGKSKEEKLEWGRFEWKEWRRLIFKRDNYTCQMCNDDTGGNLEAHHIKTRKERPDLKYEISNGITLCKKCHQSICGKEKEYEDQLIKVA